MIKHDFIGLIIRSQQLQWKEEAEKGQAETLIHEAGLAELCSIAAVRKTGRVLGTSISLLHVAKAKIKDLPSLQT